MGKSTAPLYILFGRYKAGGQIFGKKGTHTQNTRIPTNTESGSGTRREKFQKQKETYMSRNF